MGLVDQPLQDRQLVFGGADVEIAADRQFEIALFGGLGPQLEGIPDERKLRAVPALYPQRALRPPRPLSRRPVLLLQQHDGGATPCQRRGARGADDATSDDDDVGATGQGHGGPAGHGRARASSRRNSRSSTVNPITGTGPDVGVAIDDFDLLFGDLLAVLERAHQIRRVGERRGPPEAGRGQRPPRRGLRRA